ncbi:DUF5677 domain-containing protein [Arthrobacter sp. R-11]|uniref:DUF5677 domain-containing protein n=1 Tax=Arthrobacter sp. R-11 TaxID=3404053 RepID=UPI003CEA980E
MTVAPQGSLDPIAIRHACQELLDLQDSQDLMTASAVDSAATLVLNGLCQQALNHSRAAWVVVDAGFPVEATVNIRAALEHAVTAQWAFLTPNGVKRLVDGSKYKASQYFESAGLQVSLDDGADEQISAWKTFKQLPSFSTMCDDLDGTPDPDEPKSGLLRFEYVRLSQATHVTSSTITGYLAVDELTGEVALLQQAIERFPVVNLMDLGIATALACWTIESLRKEPNRLAEVEQIADKANIPSTLAKDYETANKRKAKSEA